MKKRQRKNNDKKIKNHLDRCMLGVSAAMACYDILFRTRNMFDELCFYRRMINNEKQQQNPSPVNPF